MKDYPGLNFAGNIEGNALFRETMTDVIVCDGFVGNVIIKVGEAFHHLYKSRNLKDVYFDRLDWENIGGTPIVGINANCSYRPRNLKKKSHHEHGSANQGRCARKPGTKD